MFTHPEQKARQLHTQLAEKLLWDVSYADSQATGCLTHSDPACLCDVDVTKTAHIDWAQAPAEFTNVLTVEELFETAAIMLMRLQVETYLGNHTVATREKLAVAMEALDADQIRTILEETIKPREDALNREQLSELVGAHEAAITTVRSYCGALQSRRTDSTEVDGIIRQLHAQGLPAKQMITPLKEAGHELTQHAILARLERMGIQPVDYWTWRRQQQMDEVMPVIDRLLSQGMTYAQIWALHYQDRWASPESLRKTLSRARRRVRRAAAA